MTELIPSEELERLARGWLSMGHPAISTLATELLAARKEIQNLTTCLAGQTEIANRYMNDAMGLARELGIAKPRLAEVEENGRAFFIASEELVVQLRAQRDAARAQVEKWEEAWKAQRSIEWSTPPATVTARATLDRLRARVEGGE